jgi:ribonucleoside-diphosphate reductase alpha chain
MMAAAQPFISGAISKTVNMPRETTPADIADAYLEGWQLGLKALAIYRDGSKESQPLSTSSEGDKAAAKQVAAPRRERLPDTRDSKTHKFSVAGHEGYITVGLYEDGRPGELFITMAKEGSTVGGLMDCFGTAVSMSLQYGVPLEVYVNKFSHTRFEPMGHTKNPDIRIAKSIVDYIFRWLGITFIPGFREAQGLVADEVGESSGVRGQGPGTRDKGRGTRGEGSTLTHAEGPRKSPSPSTREERGEVEKGPKKTPARTEPASAKTPSPHLAHRVDLNGGPIASQSEQFALFQLDAPSCDNCGSITVRSGNCYLCYNCGNSMGCS